MIARLTTTHSTTGCLPPNPAGWYGPGGREPATVKGPAVPTIYDCFGPPREPRDAGRTSLREFLYPQIGRPLCRVFALAADTWPERVIAADLLHE